MVSDYKQFDVGRIIASDRQVKGCHPHAVLGKNINFLDVTKEEFEDVDAFGFDGVHDVGVAISADFG